MDHTALTSYYVYILASRKNGTLYTGVKNAIARRIREHREGIVEGFIRKFRIKRVVYFEHHPDAVIAIQRERNIKHWPRRWKIALIEQDNPDWNDLYGSLNL